MLKLVFLDFDGVLVTFVEPNKTRRPAVVDPGAMEMLNRVSDLTQASVVVTSSWSRRSSDEQIFCCLRNWGYRGFVQGCIRRGTSQKSKEHGIEVAIEELGVGNYAVLDDEKVRTFGGTQNLVRTNPTMGLTMADSDRAIGLLMEKI